MTDSLSVTYNSATATETSIEAAGMTDSWKQWEGHVVNGEFPMQRYLGGSDHSAVFLTQRRLGEPRKAVLKFIPADLNDSESQILRWKLAMKLPHPNLLRIFDAGRCELAGTGFLYIVMECAEEDLSQIIPHRALTPAEAKDVLHSVLQALAYLHGKGFAQGRVRPTNIMAVADQVKVASDTLAAAGEKTSPRLPSNYDPPESANGGVTPAGDMWSLGMTLVEVLTQRPFAREGTRQPAVPKEVPEPFRDIARNCLKLDPEGRWTAAQATARLELDSAVPVQQATPMAVKPVAATVVSSKPRVRLSYLVPIIAVGLALVMVAGSRIRNSRPAAEEPTTIPIQQQASQETAPVAPPPSQASVESRPSSADGAGKAAGQKSVAAKDTRNDSSTRESRRPVATLQAASTAKERVTSDPSGNGGVIHRVLPEVSRRARNTIQGKVRVNVKVAVDAAGNVMETTLASPGPSKYFARLAEQAAHDWKFSPAAANGQPVPSGWMLRFVFGRAGTDVVPVPLRDR